MGGGGEEREVESRMRLCWRLRRVQVRTCNCSVCVPVQI